MKWRITDVGGQLKHKRKGKGKVSIIVGKRKDGVVKRITHASHKSRRVNTNLK